MARGSIGLANERLIYVSIDGKEYTFITKHICNKDGRDAYVASH